jgi:hypothetical protein
MLLGWWADNGFAQLQDASCRACIEAMREGILQPWMWIGMLLGANIAMIFLPRRPYPDRSHCMTAMLTGGNLGMIVGMVAGGLAAELFEAGSVTLGFGISFLSMSLGMIGGMLLGYGLALQGIALWSRQSASAVADRPKLSENAEVEQLRAFS